MYFCVIELEVKTGRRNDASMQFDPKLIYILISFRILSLSHPISIVLGTATEQLLTGDSSGTDAVHK